MNMFSVTIHRRRRRRFCVSLKIVEYICFHLDSFLLWLCVTMAIWCSIRCSLSFLFCSLCWTIVWQVNMIYYWQFVIALTRSLSPHSFLFIQNRWSKSNRKIHTSISSSKKQPEKRTKPNLSESICVNAMDAFKF